MVIFQSYVSLPEGGASLVDTIGGASLRPRQKKEATDVINPISGDGQPLPTKSQAIWAPQLLDLGESASSPISQVLPSQKWISKEVHPP